MIPVLDSLKFKLSNILNHCTKFFWEPFDAVTIIYTFGILADMHIPNASFFCIYKLKGSPPSNQNCTESA